LTRAEHEAVVIAALEIGYLYGTAWMRFNLGTVAQTGIKRHQSRRAAGIKSGQARRRTRERTVARIRVEAKKIRSAYPYDRSTHSTRWLAKTIQHRLGLRAAEVEAVRQSLRAAGLK
jgi:hypothetical protein